MKKIALLFSLLLAVPLGLQAQESFALANSSTGTTVSHLAKVVVNAGVPQAQITATTDTSGAVGIVAPDPNSGAGTTGQVIITRSGIVPCVFDNTTVAGDFVQIASGTAGDCHDVGTTRPTSGQIIGVVIQQGGAAGTYNVLLDKSILAAASSPSCAALGSSDTLTQAGATLPGTFATTCSLGAPAGVGSVVIVEAQGVYTTTATVSPNLSFSVNAGGTTGICPQVSVINLAVSQTNGIWDIHCAIQIATLGSPGTAWAWGRAESANNAGGSPLFKLMGNINSTASFNTSASQTVALQSNATPVAGQTVTLQSIKAYILNP